MLTSRPWIPEHPDADLSVDALARRVAMSPRTSPMEIVGRGPPLGREREQKKTATANEIQAALGC